ncbi:MAG: hypothetical protein ACOYBQ_00070 [Fluviibacter sp.]
MSDQRGLCMCCLIGLCLQLIGCGDGGAPAGRTWIEQQSQALVAPVLPPVPAFVVLPPAVYAGEPVHDPFAVERARSGLDDRIRKNDGVVFADAPLSALVMMGYLMGEANKPVAMIRSGADYRAIRVGDRLGDAGSPVQQITARGVQVLVDGSSQWLALNRP